MGKLLLLVVFLFVISTRCQSQVPEPVCKTACSVGQTCAMVRNGDHPPAPECIELPEMILLDNALKASRTGSRSSGSETGTRGTLHSHDTGHGFVTHEHPIPSQTSTRDTSQNSFQDNRDPAMPSFRPFPFQSRFQGPFRRRFPFPGPNYPFLRPQPGRFIPVSSFMSGSISPQSSMNFDPQQTTRSDIIPGLTFARGSPDLGRSSTDNFGEPVRPTQIQPTNRPTVGPMLRDPSSAIRQFQATDAIAQCRRCNSHLECLPDEFCAMSDYCLGNLVCQGMS